jgi:DNA-binding winged helix-turn-helix (wHTH) protein/Tol biopolymer transport system component
MNQPDSRNWQIGLVIFDHARRELRLGQQSAYLEPKLFTLLLLLLDSPNYQVSRDQLIADVWSSRVVSESAINRVISLLRKAFSTLDPYTHYIETLPKVGYRLAAQVNLIAKAELPAIHQSNQQRLAELVASSAAVQTVPASTDSSAELSALQTEQLARTDVAVVLQKTGVSRWLWGAFLLVLMVFLTWHLRSYWYSPNWLNTTERPVYLTYEAGSETSLSVNSTHIFYQRQIAGAATELWFKPINDRHTPAVRLPVRSINDASQRQPTEAALVVNGRLSAAALSPDGQWLVFAEYQSQRCMVFLMSTASPHMRPLFDCPADSEFQASWQADSHSFFYRQRQNKTKPYAVHRYTLATAKQQQLTAPASDNLAGSLLVAAAPLNQTTTKEPNAAVAILRYVDQKHTELLLLNEPNWHLEAVDIFPMNISNLQWLRPDLLLLSSGTHLYQYHLPTKQLAPLYTARENVDSFYAVADRIFVAEEKQQSNIRRVSRSSGESERVVSFEGLNIMPRVRSDDQQMFFLSNVGGHLQIWQQTIGSDPTVFSELPHPSFTRLALSSDQQSLVFSQLGAVFQLDLTNGVTKQLLGAEYKANVVNLDNASNRLLFSSDRSGDWQLWQYDLAKDTLEQLTQDGGYSGIIAGNDLYFTRYHQAGLWRQPLDSGNAELLIPNVDVVNWLNWQIDQQHIYFYRPDSGIWQYEITSKQEQLLLPAQENFVHQFHVSAQYIHVVERHQSEGNIAQLTLKTQP